MIIIKDMKMPSGCYDCPFAKNERTNDYGYFSECGILDDYKAINLLEHSKHPNCPLIEQESIFDKIRAEIDQLETYYDNDYFSGNRDSMFKCNEVLQIIDKYKAESGG